MKDLAGNEYVPSIATTSTNSVTQEVQILTYAKCSFCRMSGEYCALFTLPKTDTCICNWCIWNFGDCMKQPQNQAAIEQAKQRRNELYRQLGEPTI